jgi:hypothetical protein
MTRLRAFGLCYLATPYTKYRLGLHAAFADAARLTGKLLAEGVIAYSPIAHLHPVGVHADLALTDYSLWRAHNLQMIARCDALIVGTMAGWKDSVGVLDEIELFGDRPRFLICPQTLAVKEMEAEHVA